MGGKRINDASASSAESFKRTNVDGYMPVIKEAVEEETADNLKFEDPFGDDMEEEEVVQNDDQQQPEQDASPQVYQASKTPLGKDEVLDYDPSAYDLYYSMTAEWPSLSLDIIRDSLGPVRTRFPHTVHVVTGSQADKSSNNTLSVMKMSQLHKTSSNNEEEEEDEEDDTSEMEPVLESQSISHFGGVNRIRSMPQKSQIVATWADTGNVHLYDISSQLNALAGKPKASKNDTKPFFTFSGHADEGYAMDWSKKEAGKLVTGDCKKYIYEWQVTNTGDVMVDKVPFSGHSGSVEDLQWSPSEQTVFASCSVDQSIRIWDTRKKAASMLSMDKAHDEDINVISWNTNVSYLLVSGSDDGSFKIWDLRNFKASSPVAHFRYHTAPVTSVEWHPTDESVLAVSGADNQISIWDMSVEEDKSSSNSSSSIDVPPQLLFVHQGQTDIKELHFHPQIPGLVVSTAVDGFNVFKPSNIS